jgi:NADPH:quinone reductase-like Zn-dependent oxidoreductase
MNGSRHSEAELRTEFAERWGDLAQRGTVKPVIDSHYPLEQVAEALRRREEGRAAGKVVITVASA